MALSLNLNVPVAEPTAVGEKVTPTMQLAPAATLVPQVLLATANWALAVMLMMLRVVACLLVSATVLAALVIPATVASTGKSRKRFSAMAFQKGLRTLRSNVTHLLQVH
jgi:hypothetical protein